MSTEMNKKNKNSLDLGSLDVRARIAFMLKKNQSVATKNLDMLLFVTKRPKRLN